MLINSELYEDVKQGDIFLIEDRELKVLRTTTSGTVLVQIGDEIATILPGNQQSYTDNIQGIDITNLIEVTNPYEGKEIDLSISLTMKG